MPVVDPYQHVVPAATGEQPERAAFDRLSASIRDVKTVSSEAARAALVADLVAAGDGPTTSNPLLVWRQDAPDGAQLEVTTDGSAWSTVWHGDTGWVTVTVVSGWTVNDPLAVRRVGAIIFWRGSLTRTIDAETDVEVVAAGGVPTWARPAVSTRTRSKLATLGSQDPRAWVTTTGQVMVRTNVTGGQSHYYKGLGGYSVED